MCEGFKTESDVIFGALLLAPSLVGFGSFLWTRSNCRAVCPIMKNKQSFIVMCFFLTK